jgi:hypothetical protein
MFDYRNRHKKCQSASYKLRIKNASTSSVDKSVHDERFTYFLSYKGASE